MTDRRDRSSGGGGENRARALQCALARGEVDALVVGGRARLLNSGDALSALETELAHSRRLLDSVVGNAPVILWSIDAKGRILYSCGRGLERLGSWSNRNKGRLLAAVFSGHPGVMRDLKRALDGEEFTTVTEIGDTAWETRVVPVKDEAGAVAQVVCVSLDVSERVQAQKDLRKSESLFRVLFDGAPDGLIVVDPDSGKVVMASLGAARLFRRTKEAFAGMHFTHLLPPDLRKQGADILYGRIASASGQKRPRLVRTEIVREDGVSLPVEVSGRYLNIHGERRIFLLFRDVSGRVASDRALRESEKRYHALYDNAPDAIFIMQGGLFVDCNRRATEMFGCPREEIVNASPVRFSPERQADGMLSSIAARERIESVMTGDPRRFEWTHCRADGTPFEAEVSLNRIEIYGQKFLQAIVRDVSSESLARRLLAESEERFRTAFENAPYGMAFVDLEGYFLRVNEAFARMLGYRREELVGRAFVQITYPEDREASEAVFKSMLAGEVPCVSFEKRYVRKDGRSVWAEISSCLVRDRSGKALYFVSQFQDVTEAREAAREREEAYQLMRTLIDATPDLIFFMDPGLRYIGCNRAYREFVQKSEEDIIGAQAQELFPQETAEQFLKADMEARESGKAVRLRELCAGPDGEMVLFDSLKVPYFDKGGKPLGVLGICRDVTEQERMAEDLRRAFATLHFHFENSPLAVVEWDADLRVGRWSARAEDMFGWKESEVLGRGLLDWDFVHEEDRGKVRRLLDRIRECRVDRTVQYVRNYDRGGSVVWCAWYISVLYGSEGEILSVLLLGDDITQNMLADEEKEKVFNDLFQIIETASAPIFGLDRSGKVDIWNRTAESVTGFAKKEVLGRDLLDAFIPPESREFARELFERAFEGRLSVNFELPVRTRDGGEVVLLLNAAPRRDVHGQVMGAVSIGQDITESIRYRDRLEDMVKSRTQELHQALQEARGARESMDAVLRSVADSLIVTDGDGKIRFMNPTACQLFNVRGDDGAGADVESLVPDEAVGERFRAALSGAGVADAFEFSMPGDGQEMMRHLGVRTARIRDRKGEDGGMVAVVRDMTREKEIDRMKSEFLSVAAHELRTPLTSIMGFSELLRVKPDLPAEKKAGFLEHIHSQSVMLSGLVSDLLDLSRIETGTRFDLRKRRFGMEAFVRKVVGRFESLSAAHTFVVEFPDGETEVELDRGKIGQVLENILGNAVKYSPEGGEIRVRGEHVGGHLRLSVSDQGIGMTAAQLERIFDKFYRADTSDSAPEGTGLGMTIVRNIVEAHDGCVWVESEYGSGTTVHINIPVGGRSRGR